MNNMKQSSRVIYNSLTNYGRAFIQGVVSFILVPFIIKHIGSDTYGIVLLAITAFNMIELFGMGLSKAVLKYYAEYRVKNDFNTLNNIFNSSLLWFVFIGILGSIITFIIGYNFENIFHNISPINTYDGKSSFYIISLIIIPSLFFDVYKGILSGEQRYDIINIVAISSAILRAICIILYFLFQIPSLLIVVKIYAIFFVIERLTYGLIAHKYLSFLKYSMHFFSKNVFKLITRFATMILIAVFANLFSNHIFKFIIGIKLSVNDVTYFSVLLLITTTASLMVNSVVNVLVPVVSKYQGMNEKKKIQSLFLSGSKFSIVVIIALLGITIPYIKTILILWLGTEFSKIWVIGIVLFVGQIVSGTSITSIQVLSGMGKVKFIAFSSLSTALLSISLSWFYLTFSIQPTLFGASILISIQFILNSLALNIYIMYYLDLKSYTFQVFFKPIVPGLLVFLFSFFISSKLVIDNWYQIILLFILIEFIYFFLIYIFILEEHERKLIILFFKKN